MRERNEFEEKPEMILKEKILILGSSLSLMRWKREGRKCNRLSHSYRR